MKELHLRVMLLTGRMKMECLGIVFSFNVAFDKIEGKRVYIQIMYASRDSKGGSKVQLWKGRKWYLSPYMTDDEIVKTCYAAFEMAVKHEILEGFQVDGKALFNPHVDFEELLKISHKEVTR